MGKKDGGIKGEPYSRRIIETRGENKEFDKFRFVCAVPSAFRYAVPSAFRYAVPSAKCFAFVG